MKAISLSFHFHPADGLMVEPLSSTLGFALGDKDNPKFVSFFFPEDADRSKVIQVISLLNELFSAMKVEPIDWNKELNDEVPY
jgi:hypothetical protein